MLSPGDVSGDGSAASGPVSLASKLSAFRDMSILVNEVCANSFSLNFLLQIETLHEAVRYLSSENTKLSGRKFHVN